MGPIWSEDKRCFLGELESQNSFVVGGRLDISPLGVLAANFRYTEHITGEGERLFRELENRKSAAQGNG